MLDHLNLGVKNFAQSAEWYKKVFGFEIVEQGIRRGKPWGVLRRGENMLCIYEYPDLKPMLAEDPVAMSYFHISHFGWRVDDKKAWEDTIKREKLKVFYGGAIRYPHSYSWYVEDPSGYEIEVVLWDENKVKFE